MPSTLAGFGFKPVRSLTGGHCHVQTFGSRTLGVNGISASDTNPIYIGQLVLLTSSGVMARATAAAVNTLGVFAGCEYDDATGRHQVGYWPGTAGATNIVASVYTDPNIVYQVQADATMTVANIGENFNPTAATISNGSVSTGFSAQTLGVSTTTTSAASVQLIGFADRPDNLPGDTFPICEVKRNVAVESASYSGI